MNMVKENISRTLLVKGNGDCDQAIPVFTTQKSVDVINQIKEHIKNADIVVGAVGIARFIEANWIKDGAIIIDAGYHPEQCGDIDLHGCANRSLAYTPVPGGVGPMTINTLILQTIEACET